jgi:taurine dioxygenase
MTAHAAHLEAAHSLFDITPLQPSLGALVSGLDMAKPPTGDVRDALHAALLTYRVLFFRDQDITREQHIAFGAAFGELEVHPVFSLPDYPQILPLVSSEMLPKYRDTVDSNWHADTTFRATPSAASILRAVISPSIGGDTVFANTVEAYERLPEPIRQRIDGLSAVHDSSSFLRVIPEERHEAFMAENPAVVHPVVRVHPETGEKSIYVNSIFTTRILDVDEAENAELLGILFDIVKRPELQVRWSWRPNSIAFWDNRATQHYAVNDYAELRSMERVTIVGDAPVGPAGN